MHKTQEIYGPEGVGEKSIDEDKRRQKLGNHHTFFMSLDVKRATWSGVETEQLRGSRRFLSGEKVRK